MTERKVLDVDLDGVCADYTHALADWLIRQGRLPAGRYPVATTYEMTEADGWPFKDGADYLASHKAAETDHLYATMPVIEGAPEGLQALDRAGVYIRIVTHRLFVSGQHRLVVTDTARWLDDHRIPYMSLCFSGLKDTMHADLHLDDSPANIQALRAAGERTCVFDQPYNRDAPGLHIRDWGKESVETLLRLLGV